MGGINLFGLVLVALGGLVAYLGISGRYQVFTGAASGTSTSNSSAATAQANTTAEQQAISQGIAVGSNNLVNAPTAQDILSASGSGVQAGIANSQFFF